MSKIARRTFMQVSAAATAGVFLQASRDAVAQDLPQVDLDSAAAQALKYTHDASTVDAADRMDPAPEQTCANCLYIQGDDGDDWRPCALFPNQLVASAGWCSAWKAKI